MEAWRAYQRRWPWVMVMLIGMPLVVFCDNEVESLLHSGGITGELGEEVQTVDTSGGNTEGGSTVTTNGDKTAEEGAKTADKLNEAEKTQRGRR